MRPPLTVVLINNAGGGIFSFLPIASDVQEDVFTQLWSAPQNVDLAGALAGLSQGPPALLTLAIKRPAVLRCAITGEATGSLLPACGVGVGHLVGNFSEPGSLGGMGSAWLQACAGRMALRIRG